MPPPPKDQSHVDTGTKATVISGGDVRPVPDPTALTTLQLKEAISSLREIIETRLDGMDKAIQLLQVSTSKMPEFVREQVSHLQALHKEKFDSIDKQFSERDTRTDKTAELNQKAIDAALQAAKEAVGEQNKSSALAIAKSEAATTKQIDQIQLLIKASNEAMSDKVEDLKNRQTTYEGRGLAYESRGAGQKEGISALWGAIIGVIALIGAIIAIIGAVASLMSKA